MEKWKKENRVILSIKNLVFKERLVKKLMEWYVVSWDTLDTKNFYFLLFFWLYRDFFFLLDDEEAHDIAVTWHVTWCDVISLEHGGKI